MVVVVGLLVEIAKGKLSLFVLYMKVICLYFGFSVFAGSFYQLYSTHWVRGSNNAYRFDTWDWLSQSVLSLSLKQADSSSYVAPHALLSTWVDAVLRKKVSLVFFHLILSPFPHIFQELACCTSSACILPPLRQVVAKSRWKSLSIFFVTRNFVLLAYISRKRQERGANLSLYVRIFGSRVCYYAKKEE